MRMAAERRQRLATWTRTYSPPGILWIIGAYVLYRGLEFANDQSWGAAIRSYLIGLTLVVVASALTSRCRRDDLVDDLIRCLILVETDRHEQWQIDAPAASEKLSRALDDARRHGDITPVHIVRDEHSSP